MKKFFILMFIYSCISNVSVFAGDFDIISLDKPELKKKVNNDKIEKYTLSLKSSVEEKKDITVKHEDGIYIIKVDTNALKGEVEPYYVVNLTTNKEVYDLTGARLVINAGFFDPKNHQTVSYLTLNERQILDPHNNSNLMNNKHLKPYMDKILNRSELRILKNISTGEKKFDIAPHNTPIETGYKLIHSIQGGPGLVPDLRLKEEFFVLTDNKGNIISESASSLSKYARTLVGIKDNNLYFVIATTEHPITLPEAAEILKKEGFEKAMAFDGGGSVSLDYRDENIHIISDKDKTARKLKSFLIITDVKQPNPDKYIIQKISD